MNSPPKASGQLLLSLSYYFFSNIRARRKAPLYKPALRSLFHEKVGEGFLRENVFGWIFASKRFEVPDKMRLIVIPSFVNNLRPIGIFVFDQLKDVTEPHDSRKEFRRQPYILLKQLLQ